MAPSQKIPGVVTSVAVKLISRFDEQRIQRALAPLIEKRLRATKRVGTLHLFMFGDDRTVPVRFPKPGGPAERTVTEYALQVQCSWRFVVADAVPIGRAIERITSDNEGGARFELSDQVTLELTPSGAGEYWRFLRPGTNERHFVVSEHGIYLD